MPQLPLAWRSVQRRGRQKGDEMHGHSASALEQLRVYHVYTEGVGGENRELNRNGPLRR
jgi:hypothetical protein